VGVVCVTKKTVTKISTLYRVDGHFGLLSRIKKSRFLVFGLFGHRQEAFDR
jgi:hypothetical protein